MSILIILLKIIAIILAILLVFLLLCLFHPVFYQVEGILEENSKPVLKGYFWWLFQILRLEMLFLEGKLSLKIRIFGIGKELSGGSSKDESEEKGSGKDFDDFAKEESGGTEEKPEKSGEDSSKAETVKPEENLREKPQEAVKIQEEPEGEEKETSFLSKFKKKQKKRKKIRKKKSNIGKEEKKEGRFSTIKRELSDEKNKLALSHVWREVLYLLSHLKPKYAKGEIHFSTGDPAFTGEVTGVLSLCPLFYKYKLHVYPDFASDRFYILGNLAIKGHMSLYQLVLIVIRLLGDKNFRRLIKKIRK